MPDENRVFDVTRPRNVSPSATSKPVIVGHQPRVADPMVREEDKPSPTKISINDAATEEPAVEPTATLTTAPAIIEPTGDSKNAAELSQPSRPMPQYDPVVPVSLPEESVAASLPNAPEPMPQSHDHGAHIEGLHLSPPRRKSRAPRYLALVVVLLIAAYLALDSGLISTGINLPFHVFKQKTQPAASTTAPQASNQNQNVQPAPSIPAGFKEYQLAGTNLTFAAPLAWGDPTSMTDPGYSKRGDDNQSDGTYAYLVNFATNKDVQIAVTSGKYLPPKRTPLYYDYLKWCVGTNDGNIYKSVLHFTVKDKVDTPTTVTCDEGPLTDAQKIDDSTIVQLKTTDSQKKVVGDIYTKDLNDPTLVVFRVKDTAMTSGNDIKQLLATVHINSAQ